MLSTIARLMLTASSLAPVSFTYAWVAGVQGERYVAALAGIIGAVAVMMCLLVLRYAQRHLESLPLEINTIEPADSENIGFMLLYLFPLFTNKIHSLSWDVLLPTIIVFGLTVATGYGYHFNPLLGLMRWHFYKVSSRDGVTYVFITRQHIRTAAQGLAVGQLTEYILLDLGDK